MKLHGQKQMQQLPFEECILSDAKLFIKMLMQRLSELDLPDYSSWNKKVKRKKNMMSKAPMRL